MELDEVTKRVEAVYQRELTKNSDKITVAQGEAAIGPPGGSPIKEWHVAMPWPLTEDDDQEMGFRYFQPAGKTLLSWGLEKGCTVFALPLRGHIEQGRAVIVASGW